MATKEVDVIFNLTQTGTGAKQTVSGLKAIEQQAKRTKQKMQELSQVGMKLGLVGAAILAPFAIATKKYVDNVKESLGLSRDLVDSAMKEYDTLKNKQGVSQQELNTAYKKVQTAKENLAYNEKNNQVGVKMLELSERWEDSQVRLGKVTATILLPLLQQGADILDQIITFAEANPDVVRAALGVGATLVVLGGLITTTAQIIGALATIQGLAASVGIALGGGGAAAAAAGGVAVAGEVAVGGGLTAAAIGTAVATIAIPVLIAGLFTVALVLAANLGLEIGNRLAGTNQTWGDIGATLQNMLIILAVGADNITRFFGGQGNLEGIVSNALGVSDNRVIDAGMRTAQTSTDSLGGILLNAIGILTNPLAHIADAIAGLGNLFGGGKASGGYLGNGFYRVGEDGKKEFVLNNATTSNLERILGGKLTQTGILSAIKPRTMGQIVDYLHGQQGTNNAGSLSGMKPRTNKEIAQYLQQQQGNNQSVAGSAGGGGPRSMSEIVKYLQQRPTSGYGSSAEEAISGKVVQEQVKTVMTENYNMNRGDTIRQTRREVRQEMRKFKDGVLSW